VTLRIDHVVYAVRDLDVAAARLLEEVGLRATPGGTHARWGTANRIASLGGARYVELIAIVDPAVRAVSGRRRDRRDRRSSRTRRDAGVACAA
jgi:hypothetical protein